MSRNPHTNPHYGDLDCNECHRGHSADKNDCDRCHRK
jgi:hypothetical protein